MRREPVDLDTAVECRARYNGQAIACADIGLSSERHARAECRQERELRVCVVERRSAQANADIGRDALTDQADIVGVEDVVAVGGEDVRVVVRVEAKILEVLVVCVVEGEVVNAPSGSNSQWLKVTGLGPSGYASAAFVAVGDDLRNKKIPTCPPV